MPTFVKAMKKLPIILVLMSLALIGIITMQAYSISRAVKINSKRFEHAVNEALNQVALQLEKEEAIQFLGQNLPQVLPPNALSSKAPGAGRVKIEVNTDSLQADNGEAQVNIHREINFPKGNQEGVENIYQWQNGDTAMVIIEATGDYDEIKNKILSKTGQFYNMVDEFLSEIVVQDIALEDRVDSTELAVLLDQELKRNGLNIKYQFAVTQGDYTDEPVIQSHPEISWWDEAFSAALFPSAVLTKPGFIHVYFPNKSGYYFKQLALLIGLSLLFTGIIFYIFASTIRIILRQKKLSEIKTDFINNMTHEFKTPIATVNLATDALMNNQVSSNPDKLKHYVQIIREESKRMNSHVERVLQISLLDRNQVDMQMQSVHVAQLIDQVVEKMALQVKDRGGEIQTHINLGDLELDVDHMHFSNVLSNLIDNAIKYSEQPPNIEVYAHLKKERLIIAVKDYGMGMDQETQKRVFEKFYRKPTGNVHNIKGFGLGLSYVKAVVEAHGGVIQVKSELQKGSTFTIELPTQKNK